MRFLIMYVSKVLYINLYIFYTTQLHEDSFMHQKADRVWALSEGGHSGTCHLRSYKKKKRNKKVCGLCLIVINHRSNGRV